MLEELRKYENLGTPNYFWEFYCQLKKRTIKWTKRGFQEYFSNRIIDKRVVFDGCIPFAEAVEMIKIKNGKISLNKDWSIFEDSKSLTSEMLKKSILNLLNDKNFIYIFSPENISYDIVYNLIEINNSAFKFKFSNFKQFLLDFGFLKYHPNHIGNKYVISDEYKIFFDDFIISNTNRKKISFQELQLGLQAKLLHGREAEEFVLNFERKRLLGIKTINNIKIISDYDVGAGFDLISYENSASKIIDRFIEVKSYSDDISFYWSRNEIDVARIKTDKYYLYLVDRNKIKCEDYSPIIVKNPYNEIINGDTLWNKSVENFFVTKK